MAKDGLPLWVHKKTGFLTQAETASLWGKKAGPHLHRRNARDIMKESKPVNLNEVVKWKDKIVGLLNRHFITSPDDKYNCYFIMNNGKDEVHSTLLERID